MIQPEVYPCGKEAGETACRCGWAIDNLVRCDGTGESADPELQAMQGACQWCGNHHDEGTDCEF